MSNKKVNLDTKKILNNFQKIADDKYGTPESDTNQLPYQNKDLPYKHEDLRYKTHKPD